VFNHEAAAVDPVEGRLYLTEDESDGGFYRFTPARYPSLSTGQLEVAVVRPNGSVAWREVPDPSTAETGVATRAQVAGMTRFRGGEGIWHAKGILYFTTKGDKRVWAYDAARERIEVLYDREQSKGAALDAVDNVTVTPADDVFVCEDGGNLEIGLISKDRAVSPFLRFVGDDHTGSELCGVCFDPSGTRMYLTSQRAFPLIPGGAGSAIPTVGNAGPGAVYEVRGPFRLPREGMTADYVYGPPAGELRPSGPLNPGPDSDAPQVAVRVARKVARRSLLRRGLAVRVGVPEGARVAIALRTPDLSRRPGRGGSTARPRSVRLAKARGRVERGGSRRLRLHLGRGGRARLRRRPKALNARLIVSSVDGAGNRTIVARLVRVGRLRRRRRR
jgi:hypothetical protein